MMNGITLLVTDSRRVLTLFSVFSETMSLVDSDGNFGQYVGIRPNDWHYITGSISV